MPKDRQKGLTKRQEEKAAITKKGHNYLNGLRPDRRTALVIAAYMVVRTLRDNYAKDAPQIVEALNRGLVGPFPRSATIERSIGDFMNEYPKAKFEDVCNHFLVFRR